MGAGAPPGARFDACGVARRHWAHGKDAWLSASVSGAWMECESSTGAPSPYRACERARACVYLELCAERDKYVFITALQQGGTAENYVFLNLSLPGNLSRTLWKYCIFFRSSADYRAPHSPVKNIPSCKIGLWKKSLGKEEQYLKVSTFKK